MKNKIITGFVVLIVAIIIYLLFTFISETVETNKCLIVNKMYPGTDVYQECVSSIKISDYLKYLYQSP